MKKLGLILILFVSFSAFSQTYYKEIQGEYENPHLGDITINGYELTFNGQTYLYQSETESLSGIVFVKYAIRNDNEYIGVRITMEKTRLLIIDGKDYILIPKK